MLLLTSICRNLLSLKLYAVIIYYIFDVLHESIATKWYIAVQFYFVIKFSLLFLNFEVVGGIGLRTGLLIGQLTIVVRIAHFIIRLETFSVVSL